jgi:hypothetical protein
MRQAAPVFQLLGQSTGDADPALLGLWVATPADRDHAVAFGAAEAPTGGVEVWRAVLPSDPRAASDALAAGEARLAAVERALGPAEGRVVALARAEGRGPSFAAPGGEAIGQPEAELLAALRAIRQDDAGQSFGIGETIQEWWDRATGQLGAAVTRLGRWVAQLAWVETEWGGAVLARTAVGWTGDVDTAWRADAGAVGAALHRRSLGLALATRTATLRLFALAARGASLLAAALAVPGGPLLALPAAWRYVNQVVDEIAGVRETLREVGHAQ